MKNFWIIPPKELREWLIFLRLLGFMVGPKRIRRLLRKMGIMAIYPKRNLSKLGLAKYIHPYKLRNLEFTHSNQVWSIDITYVAMKKGFLYLTAIIDVYSRYVVGWGLSNSLDATNSLKALQKAIADFGKPEIVNSDQGSQFTCEGWTEYLKKQEIMISMDGKGRAKDNIWIERLWRTIKQEYIYLNPAENGKVLFKGLKSSLIITTTAVHIKVLTVKRHVIGTNTQLRIREKKRGKAFRFKLNAHQPDLSTEN